MPTLELTLDASGVERGAKQAERALTGISTTAQQTGATFAKSGSALSAAFGVSASGIQASQSIANAATQFQNLNTSAGAFAASRALLDIGRIGQDFTALSAAVGATGGGFQALGLIIRANPLLTIATVIAAAAAAMSLFGGKTKEATEELKKANTAAEEFSSGVLNIGTSGRFEGPGAEIKAIDQLLNRLRRESVPRLQIGTPDQNLSTRIGNDTEYLYLQEVSRLVPGAYNRFRDDPFNPTRPLGFIDRNVPTPNGINVPAPLVGSGELTEFLGTRRELAQAGIDREETREANRRRAVEDRLKREAEAQEQALQNMRELIQAGREFGATIGSAFFNVASGTQTARQAIAQLVAELARAAAIRGFSNLFGAAVGGLTPTQARGNAGVSTGTDPSGLFDSR